MRTPWRGEAEAGFERAVWEAAGRTKQLILADGKKYTVAAAMIIIAERLDADIMRQIIWQLIWIAFVKATQNNVSELTLIISTAMFLVSCYEDMVTGRLR